MEDGEIHEDASGTAYDPALEWPGESSSTHQHSDAHSTHPSHATGTTASLESEYISSLDLNLPPSLRLLVSQTTILPKRQTVVVADGYSELQFGRDVAPAANDMPRVRLKEMEVSKLHATVYWDQDRLEWAVVDMGSKHGTFLRPCLAPGPSQPYHANREGRASASLDPRGIRLSPPRVASIPRRLQHLDALSIGSTTFLVHLHVDRVLCTECSPQGGDQVPLFGSSRVQREASSKRKRDAAAEAAPLGSVQRDPKKALTMLKRSLLSRHNSPGTTSAQPEAPNGTAYVDRSARRRALFPNTPPDTPGVGLSRTSAASIPSPSYSPRINTPTPLPPPLEPPAPLPQSNIGHRLLMKQGWRPGTSLGQSDVDRTEGSIALIEPLTVNATTGRAGLGMTSAAAANTMSTFDSMDWRDAGKMRRWADMGSAERTSS